MMVGSPGLSIDTRSTRLSPLLAPTQLSYHNSRERILSVSSSTSSLSSEHTYPSFQRGSIDLRTKLANNSPPQQPRSPNSPHFPKERIDDPSGRYVISPRLAPSLLPKSPSQTHQPSPSSPTGSLPGFPTGYQPGHVRRRDGSASSLIIPFDPYRSRQPQSPSGKRTNKNGKAFSFYFFSSHPWGLFSFFFLILSYAALLRFFFWFLSYVLLLWPFFFFYFFCSWPMTSLVFCLTHGGAKKRGEKIGHIGVHLVRSCFLLFNLFFFLFVRTCISCTYRKRRGKKKKAKRIT